MKVVVVMMITTYICWWAGGAIARNTTNMEASRNLSDAGEGRPKNETPPPVVVTVYYETYCMDSETFILAQLYPAHLALQERLVVDFVPFGKAEEVESKGESWFECHHGPGECMGNRIHACAVKEACGNFPRECAWERRSKLMEFVFCSFAQNDRFGSAAECADKSGLSAFNILRCFNDDEGDHIVRHFARRTASYQGDRITRRSGFVPAVSINGIPNKNAYQNLRNELCRAKPGVNTIC